MPKRYFLGGLFSTKCHKKYQNGISYEKNEHSQNWKNCKKCCFGISYDIVHKKFKKLLKVCKYLFIFLNLTKLFHRDFVHYDRVKIILVVVFVAVI